MINPNIKIPVNISIEEKSFNCECCGGYSNKYATVDIGGKEYSFCHDGHLGHGNWIREEDIYIHIIEILGYTFEYQVEYVKPLDPENTQGYFEELFSSLNDIKGYPIRILEIQERFRIVDTDEKNGYFTLDCPVKLDIDFPNGEHLEIKAKEQEIIDDREQVLKAILNSLCEFTEDYNYSPNTNLADPEND